VRNVILTFPCRPIVPVEVGNVKKGWKNVKTDLLLPMMSAELGGIFQRSLLFGKGMPQQKDLRHLAGCYSGHHCPLAVLLFGPTLPTCSTSIRATTLSNHPSPTSLVLQIRYMWPTRHRHIRVP
jgi:hypothetical protein